MGLTPLDPDNALNERLATGYGGRFYGAYPALVIDNVDPDGIGRVRVRLPWSPDTQRRRGRQQQYEVWACVATLMAGNDRGTWFIPDVDDEVLVTFEAGDPRRPYVLGALWNGRDAPPETMDPGGDNALKTIRSRNGVTITLDDDDGSEALVLETPGGQTLTLRDGPGAIEVQDSNGNSILLEASGITVDAAQRVTITSGTVEISAGMITVNAGLSRFSGVVQADTVITNSVISASYTPGAGNIW